MNRPTRADNLLWPELDRPGAEPVRLGGDAVGVHHPLANEATRVPWVDHLLDLEAGERPERAARALDARVELHPQRTAAAFVRMRRAPLEALWAGRPPSPPTKPMIKEIVTIAPPPAYCIAGTAYFVPRKIPTTTTHVTSAAELPPSLS